ncbi:MAG: serine--tRNA ligase [Anaerolineae bacterium]|jgi:seryl-tRNA synthetase|nr:serine--tRNA ligase [Anaerolineae bacterium]
MLDIQLIREQPDWVKQQIQKLQDFEAIDRIDQILELDRQRRALLTESEVIQASRNKLNRAIGFLRGNKKLDDTSRGQLALQALHSLQTGDYERAAKIMEGEAGDPVDGDPTTAIDQLTDTLRDMGDRVNGLNDQVREVNTALDEQLYWIPNLPHDSVPYGDSDEQNIAHPHQGAIRTFTFEPKPHWDLGVALDIIDFERGVKLAGSRAYVLKNWGARLQRALINLFLDMARDHGFEELYVPFFVKEDMMYGAGQFPKFRDVVYTDPEADIYMLPTAEVAITNLYRDEIVDEAQLPIYMVANTPCFRREKTSAGRDVRGIKRVHQFQKVELYKFTTPETSYQELESLVEAASDVCRALELPFRRLEIVTGDLGFSATKKYDLEVWAPGCQEWLEVSSCSNTESFQARRANIKYRPHGSKKSQFVHTLNGSGLAAPRVIIAIMENYQQADGSIEIPTALRPYLGGADVIPSK